MKKFQHAIMVLRLAMTQAASSQTLSVPGYEIHYSLFPSTLVSTQVATAYEIVRGRDRALLNIAVRRPSTQAEGEAQAAIVTGTVFDLVHRRELEFQEIREENAIYYLAPVPFRDRETLYFTIDVQPDPNQASHRLEFSKTLYRD